MKHPFPSPTRATQRQRRLERQLEGARWRLAQLRPENYRREQDYRAQLTARTRAVSRLEHMLAGTYAPQELTQKGDIT